MSVVALLLAAGRGERFGRELPKAFVFLASRPLVLHALDALSSVPAIDRIVPVAAEDELPRLRRVLADAASGAKLTEPVAGGAERQDSVRAGVAALPDDATFVAVHDAARCLVRAEAIARVVAVAEREGAAILAAPARDTIKRVSGTRIVETPSRAECWAAQTPQVFRVDLLREALAKAEADGYLGTDDAELVERLGVDVHVVPGDPDDVKLTHPGDLAVAERILEERRR